MMIFIDRCRKAFGRRFWKLFNMALLAVPFCLLFFQPITAQARTGYTNVEVTYQTTSVHYTKARTRRHPQSRHYHRSTNRTYYKNSHRRYTKKPGRKYYSHQRRYHR